MNKSEILKAIKQAKDVMVRVEMKSGMYLNADITKKEARLLVEQTCETWNSDDWNKENFKARWHESEHCEHCLIIG